MKRLTQLALAIAVLACAALAPFGSASAQTGYPWYTWGSIAGSPLGSPNLPDKNNIVLDTKFFQGVEWMKFNGGQSGFITFVDLRLVADTKQEAWNNYISPGVGAMIRTAIGPGVIDFGVRGYDKAYWGKGAEQSSLGAEIFLTYWFGGDWNKKR